MITNSDAKTVGGSGLKAGVQGMTKENKSSPKYVKLE
jgi:hypothetical protein